VILIGDAPANTQQDVTENRNEIGGEAYWSKTKYAIPTTADEEILKLQAAGVPVNAFYVDNKAQVCF
jgi:hypothetical protein